MFQSLVSISEEEKHKLEFLYTMYNSFMYNISLKYLGDEHLAWDCMQQSLERIIKYLDRINEVNSKQTKSYVYRIVVSTALNMKKREEICQTKINEEIFFLTNQIPKEDEIDRILSEAESRKALEEATKNLTVEEKILIVERYGRERSFSEIAEFLNISESACRKRLERAKAYLAKLLDYPNKMHESKKKGVNKNDRRSL